MKTLTILASVALVGLAVAAPASASLIGLNRVDPDIASLALDVDYDSINDVLTAVGPAVTLTLADQTVHGITGGTFSLTADIDAAGTLLGGNLTITGTIAGLGFTSGTLLVATPMLAYGNDGVQGMDFLLSTAGGDAAGLFSPYTGVILNAGTLTPELDWTTCFHNDGYSGVADAFRVPEPATLALAGLGSLAILARRRHG